MDAIKMSSCMPMLFQPIICDKCCYIDGGIIANYPLHECMEETQCQAEEVLGLRNKWNNPNEGIGEQSSLIDYIRFINLQLIRMVNSSATMGHDIPNEVVCRVRPDVTPAEWFSIMSDAGQCLAWIEDGIAFGEELLQQQKAKDNDEKAKDNDENKNDNDENENENDETERNSLQTNE
jgi:predicted acylesterase/phospholipase RssA